MATGEVREVVHWDGPPPEQWSDEGWEFWWTEGNGACDCVRHPAFEGEKGADMPCGHSQYRLLALTRDGVDILPAGFEDDLT